MNNLPLLETEPLSPEANHRIFTVLAREMTSDTLAVANGEVVEDATISYLQPDEPARRNRRPWLLALVAAAAAVLVTTIMVRDNSARTRTNGDVTPETMPIYLPTVLPDGFVFSTGSDYTNRQNLPFRDQVYRDPAQPVGTRAIEITTSLASAWGASSGHPIVIQGRRAFDESARGFPAVRLTDGPVSIHVSGRDVTYEEIERIAGSAKAFSTNPTDGAFFSSIPDGLKLVVDQTLIPPNRNIMATYSPEDESGQELILNIWPASSMSLDQWIFGRYGTATPTTVRGHEAISFIDADQHMSGFAWTETDGVLLEVFERSLPVDQVRRTIEGLRRVSSNKWAALLKSKDIPIQDDGAPGSPVTIVEPTTAAGTPNGTHSMNPMSLPLFAPSNAPDLGQLVFAEDRTVGDSIDGSPQLTGTQVYRDVATAPGSRSLKVEWSFARIAASNPTEMEAQAAFADSVPSGQWRDPSIDPNGLFFRLTGRGFTKAELEAIARSATAPWTANRVDFRSLPTGLIEVENRGTSIEQYRSTRLDYGSVSISMNPIGSGTIESYVVETPGTFTSAKVRGHDGYVVTDSVTNTLRLVWAEAPGLLVEVKGDRGDVATLQRIAESLQPLSTDAWTKLLATVGAKPETVKAP